MEVLKSPEEGAGVATGGFVGPFVTGLPSLPDLPNYEVYLKNHEIF